MASMAAKKKLWLGVLVFLQLSACTTAHTDIPSQGEGPPPGKAPAVESSAAGQENFTPYQAPAFAGSGFDASAAQGEDGVLLDLSGLSQGYVAVSAQRDVRMKFQVEKEGKPYTYDLPADGTPVVYPLQSGDGEYTLRALENTTGTKFAEVYAATVPVTLQDEFQPFLRPSQYVNYNQGSACVKAAAGLAAQQPDALGVVDAVFDYICEKVTYDKQKASQVSGGYLPDPDETLATGKGICFDYASLAAAMLRSQGIPTKMVFGYVQPDDLYHAWNMFYTQEDGWVAAEYQAESNSWVRLDATFAANGADSQFIGDGTNYTDVYFY